MNVILKYNIDVKSTRRPLIIVGIKQHIIIILHLLYVIG